MTFVLKRIGVHPRSGFDRLRKVFNALEAVEAVKFAAATDPRSEQWDGLVLIDTPRTLVDDISCSCDRTFLLSTVDVDHEQCQRLISFTDSVSLGAVLRQRKLPSTCTLAPLTLDAERSGQIEVLAMADDEPVWFRIASTRRRVDVCRAALVADSGTSLPFQQLRSGNFIALLPLVHFVQGIAGNTAPDRESVRACFMFDDPNLHWPSFGYIDFREMLRCAASGSGFHASIATVPLDAWYSHPPTVKLFQDNPQHLSLLIHGNDHVKRELARAYSEVARDALVAQSLRRIERLESTTGLSIARVMAAPHAACTDAMGSALLRFGYQAACISRAALMAANAEMDWPVAVGLRPAEFIGGGLPVIPRFGLAVHSQASMVIAAFLGQPVILVGHHDDLANGYGVLGELADFINSLGRVQWMDLAAIARSNYRMSIAGPDARLDLYARRVEVEVPPEVETLTVRRPWMAENAPAETLVVRRDDDEQVVALHAASLSWPVSVQGPGKLVVESVLLDPSDPKRVAAPPLRAWPLTRRLLAEARDRLRPVSRLLSTNRR